ncbi:MAG: hypothetical protein U9R50_00145 [Campylobacterota bacterium]|nr:hypothetical protein [Campylobacterota bacterium]
MLNVHELERQWLRYKIKSYLPKILFLIAIVIASVLLVIYSLNYNSQSQISSIHPEEVLKRETITVNSKKSNESHVPPVDSKKIEATQLTTMPIEEVQLKTPPKKEVKQLTIKPSLHFIDSLKYIPEEVISPKKPEPKPLAKQIVAPKIENHEDITQVLEANTKPTLKPENNPSTQHFQINIQQEESDIQAVIKRFKNNKNPALSLFIAKRFYAIGNYSDAYNYALMTNELNSEIEESWLIAAKSLYKLGQKDKAINLLKKFILNSHSIRAKMILDQIKNGSLQ